MAREDYFEGREHAAVKHFFLKQYLALLCFKTLQVQRHSRPTFTYIDGFTGPWSARDKNYTDTSFGVALDVLNQVMERLPGTRVKAIFCEERKAAFNELRDHLSRNAGSVDVECIHGRFEENIEKIQALAGDEGFRFAFLDPTGWKVDVSAISPLIKDSWSEVVFNFMSEFIRRFSDVESVHQSYSTLLGDEDWRARFEALPPHLSNDEKVLRIFKEFLKERWKFEYVVELPIRKPNRDRIFYKLVYGTRSPYGVFAFREAQAKAEKEGHAVAFEARTHNTDDLFFQSEAFSSDEHAELLMSASGVSSRANRALLPGTIKKLLSTNGPMHFRQLAALTLETVAAQEKDVKVTLTELKRREMVDYTFADRNGAPKSDAIVKLM